MASFSGRGPTNDMRVKPDLVAPGIHIQGAASQVPGFDGSGVCGGLGSMYYPSGQTLYTWSSGTSHSTPAVAGAASLVHSYFDAHFGGPPSPAMVKAYLINTTRYLTGEGAGGTLPSNAQGWGETHLGMAFDSTPRIPVDQSTIFGSTGETHTVVGTVSDLAQPFRVTLAWTDAPGPTTSAAYVNDLNLAVTVGGTTYRGNVFSGETSVPGGSSDSRNNVEGVFLPAGTSGSFLVQVTAANIAGDGVPGTGDATDQDFALVIYNGTVADPCLVRVDPPSKTVSVGSIFTFDVWIENAVDMGGFQFDLDYDPGIVHVDVSSPHDGAAPGPFPGSSGRSVFELGPAVENTTGDMTYGAYTTGSNPGASGSGTLATIYFEAMNDGTSALDLNNLEVTDTVGTLIPCDPPQDGTVTVDSSCPSPTCPWDLNCDGTVNIADTMIVVSHWGETCPPQNACPWDINEDGVVNIVDIMIVVSHWGETCH
jgi:hypothetical protein